MNTPQAPDPYATAAAQTQSNKETANYQQSLNQTNQITPYGSLTYTSDGTDPNTGAPRSTANLSLSPQMQGLVDQNIGNATQLSGLQGQLAGNAAERLSHPLDLTNLSQLPTLNSWTHNLMDPVWNQRDQQAEQTAFNRGLAPGSEGYDTAMRNQGLLRDQAYNAANLANINTAIGATQAEYNQPLNALTALQSGSQVSQPGIGQTQTPQTSVAGTNLAGLVEQNYQDQLNSSNAAMGGLFGLGGSLLGGIGSAGGIGKFISGFPI